MIHVECIQCNRPFGDNEDEFGVCPECGTQQPDSGSGAIEELALIEALEKEGRYKEAVEIAMEVLHEATDVQFGDWPLAHKVADIIRRLCSKGGLSKEEKEHEEHWRRLERYEMGG